MTAKKDPFIIRIINGISEISGYLSGFAIFLACLIIMHQVLVRYFIGASTIWQTELSIYLLMFATFIGGAYGLKFGSHVGVDVIIDRLPHKAQSLLRIFTSLLSLVVTVVVGWKAWQMWHHATVMGWESETIWGPPLTYPYFILPLGMTLISLQFIVVIYNEIITIKNASVTGTTDENTAIKG